MAQDGEHTTVISISLPVSLLERVDDERGNEPRSVFARRALREFMDEGEE